MIDPDPNKGGRTVNVVLLVNEDMNGDVSTGTVKIQSALTGRNTSYGFPTVRLRHRADRLGVSTMMRTLSRLHREESGVAMVVAMMVVFVVVLLSIVILDLSIHNVDQAAYDRKRVTSVAASEARHRPRRGTSCSTRGRENLPWGVPCHRDLGSAPGPAQLRGRVHLVRVDRLRHDLSRPARLNVPSAVLVTSTGTTNARGARGRCRPT